MRYPIARGVDYARVGSVDPGCLVQQGMSFVCRYLTLPSLRWKALTREEAERLSQAGLNIVSVYQVRNNQVADFSPDHAKRDTDAALEGALAVGQPEGSAIYFAVDFEAVGPSIPVVLEYFRRVKDRAKQVLGSRHKIGIYGSYGVVDAALEAGVVDLAWQTYAWSVGMLHDRAALYQFQNGVPLCGGTVDLNYAFADPGWWRVGGVNPPQSGIHLRPLKQGDRGWDVRLLQQLLAGFDPGPIDGIFGPKTAAAVQRFRGDGRTTVDEAVWRRLVPTTTVEATAQNAEQLLKERDRYRAALEQIAALVKDTLTG